MRRLDSTIKSLLAAALLATGGAACVNTGDQSLSTVTTSIGDSSGSSGAGSGSSSSSASFTITNVSIGGSAQPPLTTVFFQNPGGSSTTTMSSVCSAGSSGSTCSCQFSWQEINNATGTPVTINRKVQTPLKTVQPFLVTCDAPSAYTSEIPDGARIDIKVISNVASLSMSTYAYFKGSSTAADFKDAAGRSFLNIHRYTCYETITKSLGVTNTTQDIPDSATGQIAKALFANRFCTDSSNPGQCAQPIKTGPSAESNYYNLYITSSNMGGINSSNQRYSCPRVYEPIKGGTGLGSTNQFYPLDTQFALSKSPSSDFPVGVRAPSVLGNEIDPSSAETFCFGDGDGGGGSGGSSTQISKKCLGFAAKPKTDGTCPSFVDSNGVTRRTYRLRKYVAIYPLNYQADGHVIPQSQAVDTVFVLDRPVQSPDPSKPYTMKGPKPCPYAYYDHSGVTGLGTALGNPYSTPHDGVPRYLGTNSSSWTGKNVDGIVFPNVDNSNSCAAAIPMVQYSETGSPYMVTLATTHRYKPDSAPINLDAAGTRTISLRRVYIRPRDAWWPHYVEDASFEACAPRADPFIDPPLHFARKTSGEVAWCAEVYPSQVDAIFDLEKPQSYTPGANLPSRIKPFTSHVVKNSASPACTATSLSIPSGGVYQNAPAGTCTTAGQTVNHGTAAALGLGRHPAALAIDSRTGAVSSFPDGGANNLCSNVTCDRTVLDDGTGGWKKFPLLAEPLETETLLKNDPTFDCEITYDNGNGKVGSTPTSGCCLTADVNVPSGTTGSTTGHLEPNWSCREPVY